MIINNLPQLIAKKQLRIVDIFNATGVSRVTLTKLIKRQSTGINFETLDKLCAYLNCSVSDLFEYRPDSDSNEGDN